MAGPEKAIPLNLYTRAQEVVEYLMEHNGYTTMSKRELAEEMADRFGRPWRNRAGDPDRKLLSDICALTKDQDRNPTASALFCGMVVDYSPTLGGMVLIDPTGAMALPHQLHMLAGDVQAQQRTKTMNRRRLQVWKAVALAGFSSGDFDLGRVCSQIENEINTTGFVSDTLVVEYLALIRDRGISDMPDDGRD